MAAQRGEASEGSSVGASLPARSLSGPAPGSQDENYLELKRMQLDGFPESMSTGAPRRGLAPMADGDDTVITSALAIRHKLKALRAKAVEK